MTPFLKTHIFLSVKLGVGTLGISGAALVLDYGKTSEKNGTPSLKIPSLP